MISMQTKMKHSGRENLQQTNDSNAGLHIPHVVAAAMPYAPTYVFMHERYWHAVAKEFRCVFGVEGDFALPLNHSKQAHFPGCSPKTHTLPHT